MSGYHDRGPRAHRKTARVRTLVRPRVPVPVIAAAGFAAVALALLAFTAKGGESAPGRLANTGSPIGPWAIAAVVVLLAAGVAFLVIGKLRKKSSGTDVS